MAVLAWEDVSGLNYSIWNKILDGGVALYIIVLFFLFRVLSPLVALWGRFTSWLSQKQGT